MRATAQNKTHFEDQRAQLEASNLKRRQDAEAVAGKLNGLGVALIRQAGESGQLYGSVSGRDIADAVTAAGFTVERRQVLIEQPIKTIGTHKVRIALHPEVIVNVNATIAQSQEEAERRAAADSAAENAPPAKAEGKAEVATATETPAEPTAE